MFLSKCAASKKIYLKFVERRSFIRCASSSSVQHPTSKSGKEYRTPLSIDPDFRAPPDHELPKAKTEEMKGITFNIRDFYKNYFPNDPIEARTPTPFHLDVYYRKQYYIIGAVLGVLFGLFVSIRRIRVDRARRSDWEKHHGDPLSYYDTVGPINPNVTRKAWDDNQNLPKPKGWISKVHEEEHLH